MIALIKQSVGALITVCFLFVFSGCSGIQESRPRQEVPGISSPTKSIAPAQEEAKAEEIQYQGWRALRLTNGMITLVAVPEIGGRILEFKLGGHPFLWINPAEIGKTYPTPTPETERLWHDFGGYKLWPLDSPLWPGPPDPPGFSLDSSAWTGKILTASGRNVEAELRSPEDKITGVQITRGIKLFGSSTHVRLTEKITNISEEIREWSFCSWAQLPGALENGARFSEQARLYIPLNPESTHANGYVLLSPSGQGQYKILPQRLLQISYLGQAGKIGVDTKAGWLAYVDELHNYAFVLRFQISQLGAYPVEGVPVLIETNAEHSYINVGLCSPKRSLRPSESYEITLDWYATRVGGPIVDVCDVAAFQKPLQLERAENKLKIGGTFGVFAPGKLAFLLQNAQGQALGQPRTMDVSPADIVKLNQEISAPAEAKHLLVELQNVSGTPLGQIAKLPLAATIARTQ